MMEENRSQTTDSPSLSQSRETGAVEPARGATQRTPCGRDGCGQRRACCRADCPIIMGEPEPGCWYWTRRENEHAPLGGTPEISARLGASQPSDRDQPAIDYIRALEQAREEGYEEGRRQAEAYPNV